MLPLLTNNQNFRKKKNVPKTKSENKTIVTLNQSLIVTKILKAELWVQMLL